MISIIQNSNKLRRSDGHSAALYKDDVALSENDEVNVGIMQNCVMNCGIIFTIQNGINVTGVMATMQHCTVITKVKVKVPL